MRVVGKEGALEGGLRGVGGNNENYVMDGQKDYYIIRAKTYPNYDERISQTRAQHAISRTAARSHH